MADTVVLAGEGAIWAQPAGPNTELVYLGCHELGDIEEPLGDVRLLYCSTEDPNRYEVIDSLQETPGGVTTSMLTDVRKVGDIMETIRCPVPLYVNVVSCGKKNVFDNWDRSFGLQKSWITRRVLSRLTSKDPETQDKAAQTFDITAETLQRIYEFSVAQLGIAETEDLLDITFCNSERCAGSCGDALDACSHGYVSGGVLAGSPINQADLWETETGGLSWAIGASKPFAAGEVVASLACFEKDKNTTRVIVARGTTDAGNPMEVAITDDDGLTWTNVDVGSVDGQYATGPKSLFVLDFFNIWLCTTGGYIYKSEDGGSTWTAQTSGDKTAQDLNAIEFFGSKYGYAVGDSNAILKTETGDVWSLVAGHASQAGVDINTVSVLSRFRVWIGYAAAGRVYYTHNGGTNWFERSHIGSGSGAVKEISFFDEYFGAMLWNNNAGAGTFMVTINGGTTWKSLATPITHPNAGFNSLYICNPLKIFVAGDAYGGTGVILRAVGLVA